MNFVKLATQAVKMGTTASKHLVTANKLINEAQTQADKHLAGTDLHRKLSTNLGVAKGHLNTAQYVADQLQKVKVNGGKKTKRRQRRKTTTRRRKTSKKRRTKRKH